MLYYIAIIGSSQSLGIIKKITGKIKILNELGKKTIGILLVHQEDFNLEDEENIHFLTYSSLDYESAFKKTTAFLEQNITNEDQILFRYPLACKNTLKILQKFPNRIWFEHNTKETEELKNNFKKLTLRDWAYMFKHLYFSDYWGNVMFLYNEKKYASQVFKLAKGGICVTDEIALYESERLNKKYKTFTVGNGILVEEIPLNPEIVYDKKHLNLVMVSSTANDWHGIDRLVKGLANYNGLCVVQLHLIGNYTANIKDLVKKYKLEKNIIFYPKTFGTNLFKLMNEMHIGIGSLGMHRIPLKQGSVLKVKEYMAMGMPFIIAHDEIDLIDKDDVKKYYLQFPADNSDINITEIIDFADRLFIDKNYPSEIRKMALKYVNMPVKMAQLINILDKN